MNTNIAESVRNLANRIAQFPKVNINHEVGIILPIDTVINIVNTLNFAASTIEQHYAAESEQQNEQKQKQENASTTGTAAQKSTEATRREPREKQEIQGADERA